MEQAAYAEKSAKGRKLLLGSISKPLDGFDARAPYSVVVVATVVVDIVAHVAKMVYFRSRAC